MTPKRPTQTTKWGTACAQCSAVKAKCSGRSNIAGSKCDRCERLLKQCTDQIPKPRKTRQPKHLQTTDAGSPSFDFDSLVSTPEYSSSPLSVDFAAESPSVGNLDRPFLVRKASSQDQRDVENGHVAASGAHSANLFHPSPRFPGQARGLLLRGWEDTDQTLLLKYRAKLMPEHPFVIIPQHILASALRTHHPFLMMSIRAIASFEGLRTMHTQMQLVRGHLADRMLLQSEHSLDLLRGIVVILGWHHYHCTKHSQLNKLLCLAESLVSDLGLNRKPPVGQNGEEAVRPTEDKRLLLGVWYLRSSAAMHLQQLTSMPFTSYMRQCLGEIQDAKEHGLDEVLVHFVKVQYLAERVAVLKSPQLKSTETSHDRVNLQQEEQGRESQESEVALAGCRAYLDRLVGELPSALKNNAMLVTQFNTVALRLSEPQGSEVVHSCAAGASPDSRFSLAPNSPTVDTLLQTAAASVKRWFQSWIAAVPASRYHTLPSHSVFQLLYAVRAVVRDLPPSQADPRNRLSPGQERSVSRSSSTPIPDPSVPGGQLGSNCLDDAVTVLNRLIALRTGGADVDKFWTALGELPDAAWAQGSAAAEHPSTFKDFPAPDDDVFSAITATESEGSQQTFSDLYPILESQKSQAVYLFNMFLPPSRVGSVVPVQREYNDIPPLPPGQVSAVRGGTQLPPEHRDQWTAAALWDAGSSSWASLGAAADVGVPEDVDQQMWEDGQGDLEPQHGWPWAGSLGEPDQL